MMQSAPGVEFDAAYARRSTVNLGSVRVDVIGLADLIESKRAAGRDQDTVDVLRFEGRRSASR